MEKLLAREKIINLIRAFFQEEGFMEVETPLLVASPDTASSNEVFETQILGRKRAFLAPSPEFFMKKVIAEGKLPKIFQICKAFRNPDELDLLHNPEFTILEWYRVNATYTDLMVDCENLINYIFNNYSLKIQKSKVKSQNYLFDKLKISSSSSSLSVLGVEDLSLRAEGLSLPKDNSKLKNFLTYQKININITAPWPRINIKEAFKKYAKINLDEFLDLKKAKEVGQKKGYKVEEKTSWEQLYHQIFLNEIETKLPKDKPVILYDYPAPLAALAKFKKSDPRYAERFEFYIGGLELGNGYSELTDCQEQEKRLKNDLQERERLEMKVFDYDHDFIKALKTMPPTAGIAVGIDRLIMLFTNVKTIPEVTSFPASEVFNLEY